MFAADYLRDTIAAPSILIGHSLGGAAVLAAKHRVSEVRAVATIAAPADPDHITARSQAERIAVVTPHMETDSVTSLYSLVEAGACASIVPHTWLRTMPTSGATKAMWLVEPEVSAQISVAIHPATPGSVTARAFVEVAQGLFLDDFFVQALPARLRGISEPV